MDRGAIVFSHKHVVSDDTPDAQILTQAVHLYDSHMRYYVDGLAWSGSTYAFPTLGSTIAVHAHSYAQVRGYPRRNAAEDFYLLNKIAKVGPVRFDPFRELTIEARTSSRVPFGTGPALSKILEQLKQDPTGRTYTSYNPQTFVLLRETHLALQQFAQGSDPQTNGNADFTEQARQLLSDLGFEKLRHTLHTQYADAHQRQRILREWFDGFRTLRFVHEARRFYPDQPLLLSLEGLPWASS